MPYVKRDDNGHIVALFGCEQFAGQEFSESAELWQSPMQQLAQADAPFTPRRLREFMRAVLEDKGEAVSEKLGVPLPQVLAANPTYQIVKAYDDMAVAARANL